METLELEPVTAPNIDTMKRANPEAAFEELSQEIAPILEQSKALTVADADKLAIVKVADEYRKDVKKLRCAVETRRKELVADLNKQTKDINAAAGKLWDICEKEEARLLEIVQHAEREDARLKEEKRQKRVTELLPFVTDTGLYNLTDMTDEAFDQVLTDAKAAHAARLERERKAEEEAEAKAKAEAAERERIRLENEQLKKEAEAREAAAKKEREEAAARQAAIEKQLAEERAAAEKEAARIKAEADAAAAKERERVAAEQAAAAAKAKKERDEIEAKAKAERDAAEVKARQEREAREKIEAELAAKKAAEAKAEADRIAAEEAAALAPEKDKLKSLAATVRALPLPTLGTEKGIAAMKEVEAKVEGFAKWIEKQAAAL